MDVAFAEKVARLKGVDAEGKPLILLDRRAQSLPPAGTACFLLRGRCIWPVGHVALHRHHCKLPGSSWQPPAQRRAAPHPPPTPHPDPAPSPPPAARSDGSLGSAAAKAILKELPDKKVYFITGGAEAWQVRRVGAAS